MVTRDQYLDASRRARAMLDRAGIVLTPHEAQNIEVADFGLNDLQQTGLEIVTYVNTERCCAKELVLFPGQTCPEHYHPPVAGEPGKEETFRCRMGVVYLMLPGEPAEAPRARAPKGSEPHYTVMREVVLNPGDQYTLPPGTKHWFQGGPGGAVVSEFSTKSRDEADIFTDPRIVRAPEIEG